MSEDTTLLFDKILERSLGTVKTRFGDLYIMPGEEEDEVFWELKKGFAEAFVPVPAEEAVERIRSLAVQEKPEDEEKEKADHPAYPLRSWCWDVDETLSPPNWWLGSLRNRLMEVTDKEAVGYIFRKQLRSGKYVFLGVVPEQEVTHGGWDVDDTDEMFEATGSRGWMWIGHLHLHPGTMTGYSGTDEDEWVQHPAMYWIAPRGCDTITAFLCMGGEVFELPWMDCEYSREETQPIALIGQDGKREGWEHYIQEKRYVGFKNNKTRKMDATREPWTWETWREGKSSLVYPKQDDDFWYGGQCRSEADWEEAWGLRNEEEEKEEDRGALVFLSLREAQLCQCNNELGFCGRAERVFWGWKEEWLEDIIKKIVWRKSSRVLDFLYPGPKRHEWLEHIMKLTGKRYPDWIPQTRD